MKVEYGTSVRSEYQYNGLNWRTVKRADTSSPPNGTLNQQRVMYYNAAWQLMEELINDSWTTSSSNDDHDRRMQYIWGLRYIDDIAVRRELEPIRTLGPGTTVTTWYHLTDTLFSTVAIFDDSAQLVERVSYDAYGRSRHHRMADLTGDGSVDTSDRDAMRGINWGDYGVGDLNRDGIVDSNDLALLDADWGRGLGEGRISATDNVVGYAGYIFNAEMHGAGLYTVRHRHYSPELGRWISRDPLEYVDGMGLYAYGGGHPLTAIDPSGQFIVGCAIGGIGGGIGGAFGGWWGRWTWRSAICGGIGGAFAGCCTGGICSVAPPLCTVAGCICGAAGTLLTQICNGGFDWKDPCVWLEIGVGTIVGCVSGLVVGADDAALKLVATLFGLDIGILAGQCQYLKHIFASASVSSGVACGLPR